MFKYLIIIATLSGSVVLTDSNEPGLIGIWNNAMNKVITKVYVGSPAEEIGVKPGDKIISFKPRTGKPGEPVTLVVERSKERLTFDLVRVVKGSYYGKYGAYYCKDGIRFEH